MIKLVLKRKNKENNPNNPKMVGAEPLFVEKSNEVGILLLHGFTSSPHQFKELTDYLADRNFTVFAPLIAGHGISPKELAKTNGNDWLESANDAFLEFKKGVKKIVIIGNSFGGNLAFSVANRQKDSIIGIVSIDTPIKLKFQWFIKLRIYTYGWFKKYYRKPQRYYKIDYTDMSDEVTYSSIPIKSLRDFFNFIKSETIPNLEKIKIPVLIAHANIDPVVDSKSATFIHEHIGSLHKPIYWFDSDQHGIGNKNDRLLFNRIYRFIKEII